MNEPTVSIIVTTYNRKDLAKLAIKSAVNQDYEDLEIIVVEDGSQSGIAGWLDKENQQKIQYLNNGRRSGLSVSRNRGLERARGKYMAFLDDDDAWLPEKISAQMAVMLANKSDKLIVTCGTSLLEDGAIKKEFVPKIQGYLMNHVFNGDGFPPSSLLIPKDIIVKIDGFSEDLKSCIDHDFWMKLGVAGCKVACVPMGLVYTNRTYQNHMKSDMHNRIKGIAQFYDKWFDVVATENGKGNWRRIERVYESQTYQTVFYQHQNGQINNQQAVSYLKNLYSQRREYSLSVLLISIKDIVVLSSFFHPILALLVNKLWSLYGLLWRAMRKINKLTLVFN